MVAGLFGLHPLHVESVAWAAERKDVLSGLFFMLTLLAYARYAERPSASRYTLVVVLFVFAPLMGALIERVLMRPLHGASVEARFARERA